MTAKERAERIYEAHRKPWQSMTPDALERELQAAIDEALEEAAKHFEERESAIDAIGMQWQKGRIAREIRALKSTQEPKEHRLIGYLKQGGFHAMMGCIHKGKIYNPADALNESEKRRLRIESGIAQTVPYDL